MQTAQSQTSAPTGLGFPRQAFHLKVPRHDGVLPPQSSGLGLCGRDRLLAENEEPPLGAHLVTPRFTYEHHGVYVGRGAVVHYAAFAKHWRGPVEETSLACFADGHPVWVRPARPTGLPCEEIVRRARSRLGEDRYRFLSNNCEHLSEWCVNGEHRSSQVERLLNPLSWAYAVLREVIRWLKVPLRAARQHSCARLP